MEDGVQIDEESLKYFCLETTETLVIKNNEVNVNNNCVILANVAIENIDNTLSHISEDEELPEEILDITENSVEVPIVVSIASTSTANCGYINPKPADQSVNVPIKIIASNPTDTLSAKVPIDVPSTSTANFDIINSINNFKIDSENFPLRVKEKLINGIKLIPSERNEMIRGILDKIQNKYGKFPEAYILEAVACKLVCLYPILEQKDENGLKIGNGYFTLLKQLKDRLCFINNPRKRKSNESSLSKKPEKTGPILKNRSAGTMNFMPIIIDEENDLNIKTWLQNECRKVQKERNRSKVTKLALATFNLQRKFFTTKIPPTIIKIKEEWPVLLEHQHLINHFKKLCGIEYELEDILKLFKKLEMFFLKTNSDKINQNDLIVSVVNELLKYFKITDSETEKLLSLVQVHELDF